MRPKFQKQSALKFDSGIIPCAKHIGISRLSRNNIAFVIYQSSVKTITSFVKSRRKKFELIPVRLSIKSHSEIYLTCGRVPRNGGL